MKRDEIAKYAYENVPFYMDLHKKGDSWEDYPVIDKKTMLIHMDSVFAPQYMGDLFANKLERVLTSGSTGECFEVFWKKSHIMKSLVPLWNKRKRYYNISPDDRRCYFFTTKIVDGKELQIEESDYGLGFGKTDLCEDRVIAIYNHMLEFNPRWLIVQPSMLILLTTMAKKHGLPPLPDLAYIELTGESITESARKSVREFFGCEVASQYGCYEVNSIACECPYGGLHVMSENVFVETVGEDDLCITSLQNKVMPFIRYKIGDKGKVIYEHSCPCGSREPVIDLQKVRQNDWIYHADGTVSHSDLFCNIVDKINLSLQQAILQYQIIQTDYEEFEVYIVINEEEDDLEIQTMFVTFYEKYQRKSKFTFYFVDYLYPSEKTGKLAWFVSKVKERRIL